MCIVSWRLNHWQASQYLAHIFQLTVLNSLKNVGPRTLIKSNRKESILNCLGEQSVYRRPNASIKYTFRYSSIALPCLRHWIIFADAFLWSTLVLQSNIASLQTYQPCIVWKNAINIICSGDSALAHAFSVIK